MGGVWRKAYRCVGVEVAAHVFNFQLELLLRSVAGALEGEMLEEVSCAVGLVGFCAAASIDPHANC